MIEYQVNFKIILLCNRVPEADEDDEEVILVSDSEEEEPSQFPTEYSFNLKSGHLNYNEL